MLRWGRSFLALLLLGSTAVSCGWGGTARSEPRYSSDDSTAQQAFDEARAAYRRGELDQAEDLFSSFIVAHQTDVLRPGAELHLGRIAHTRGDLSGAATWYELAAHATNEAIAHRARLELGSHLLAAGEPSRALDTLEPLAGRLDGREAATLYTDLAEAARQAGQAEDAVRYLDARCRYGGRSQCHDQADALAEQVDALGREILDRLLTELPRNGAAWPVVALKRLRLALQDNDVPRAEELVASLEGAGVSVPAEATKLHSDLEEATNVDWGAVGVLLPKTGRARIVGDQMERGLDLALRSGDEDDLRVIVRDTGGSAGTIEDLIDDLVDEERVAAIIGPVDAGRAEAAARRAQERGVPLLALTIRPQVAEAGRWVLRTFQSNPAEVAALVGHATTARSMSSFAVLYPDQPYGRVMKQLFEAEVERRGGQITVARSYEPARTSFVDLCQELADHEFEALFVPDRARTVSLVAPALAAAGLWSTSPGGGREAPEKMRPVQLLVPSVGFDTKLVRKASRYLQGALFAVALFAQDQEPNTRRFVDDFSSLFDEAANPYASQAHDALQLVRAARQRVSHPQTRRGLLDALLDLERADTAGRFEGFDSSGEPISPMRLVTLEGEALTRVE